MFDRTMEGNGGANNAYTSTRCDGLPGLVPSSALELIFDLEADRIRDLSFDPKMVIPSAAWWHRSDALASTTVISCAL